MTDEEKAAKKAADEEAKKKAAEEKAAAEAKKTKQVRVICEGKLGTQLLEKDAVTDDTEYVAILEQKGQKKVELVK